MYRHSLKASCLGIQAVGIATNFSLSQSQPTLVYEDNLACITMSINPVRRKYSRHIDIRKHYLRELCLRGLVKLIPLRIQHVVADALTMSLPASGLARHRSLDTLHFARASCESFLEDKGAVWFAQ
jgi:hypothetical protein